MIVVEYSKPISLKSCPQVILVKFKYKLAIVNVIRNIQERIWHDEDDKFWELPFEALSYLQSELPKEKFKITGKPISDKKYGEKEVDHSITLPKTLNTELFPYQKATFDEGMAFDKYIYNLSTGCGKTITALATALKRIELNQVRRCLVVVCVNGLKYTWSNQILEHCSGVGVKILGNRKTKSGYWQVKSNADKLKDLNNLEDDCSFYITNIESLRDKAITDKLVKLCDKGEFNFIIVDEIHRCASPSAQQSKALLRLENHVKYTLLLTGTILINKPNDLYIPLKIVGGEKLNYTQFKNRYNIYGGFGGWNVIGYKNLSELQKKLMNASKRVRKEDVLKDLPPKIFTDEYVDMGTKQTKIYNDVLNALINDLDNISLSIDPLSKMVRLRQATADTAILSTTIKESAKFQRALDIINELIEDGESVIVFSNWETVIDNFRKYLADSGIKSCVVTGKVKDREIQLATFLNDSNISVICGTVGALGTGYTLNKASNVIFLDEPWNQALKIQCMDRCHRIGQTNNVTVYTLMCRNTIDETIHKVVLRKGVMSDSLVDSKYDLKNKEVLKFLLTGEGKL